MNSHTVEKIKRRKKKISKLKEYRIGLFYEVGGYTVIKAKSEKEAKKIGLEQVEKIGNDAIKDVTHRECYNV